MSFKRCEACNQIVVIGGNHDCQAIQLGTGNARVNGVIVGRLIPLTPPTPQMKAAVAEAFDEPVRRLQVAAQPKPDVTCIDDGDDCLRGYCLCSTCGRCLLCSAAAAATSNFNAECADCEEPTLVCCDLIESRRRLGDEHAKLLGQLVRLERATGAKLP